MTGHTIEIAFSDRINYLVRVNDLPQEEMNWVHVHRMLRNRTELTSFQCTDLLDSIAPETGLLAVTINL